MKKALQSLVYGAVFCLVLAGAQQASAHILIDEDFEDGVAFDSLCPNFGGDVFVFNDNKTSASPCLVITHTGELVAGSGIGGSNGYVMEAGEGLRANTATTVTLSWNGQTTGPHQYLQLLLNVSGITAAAGTECARLEFFWIDLEPGDYVVRFVSDGAGGVNVLAGLDSNVAGQVNIGNIAGGLEEWKMVTVHVQKNAGSDSSDPLHPGAWASGAHFYLASETPQHSVAATPFVSAAPPRNPAAIEMDFQVSNGTFYLDTIYWEGGMTATDEGRDFTDIRNLRSWTVPVSLNHFGME